MKSLKKLLFCLFLALFSSFSVAQIASGQLFNPQRNDHTPVISLGETLILSFDDLNNNYIPYEYSIIYYDRNWNRSSAFTSEFLKGQSRNRIKNYTPSFNTRMKYTHYEVALPNDEFSFLLSGNYAIQVLEPKTKKKVLEKRFYIIEPRVNMAVSIQNLESKPKKNQRVSVRINTQNINFLQETDYTLKVVKNNNFANAIVFPSANFTQPHELLYTPLENDFEGGSEFNFFDTKNLNIPALSTEKIANDSIYHTFLYPNAFFPENPYNELPDIDGDFYIRTTESGKEVSGNEADYTWVYFALDNYTPLPNEEIFIYGGFNDFSWNEDSTLRFNPRTKLWETRLLLKQGYYNYNFGVRTASGIDYSKITGSYWQTENKYGALFYFRPWGKRYDLLIGYGEGFSKPPYR